MRIVFFSLENDVIRAIHRKNSDLLAVKKVFSYYTEDYEQLYVKINWVEADITDICQLEISFENIMNKMAYLDNIQNNCGKNFEKCRTVSDAELKKETNRQNEILKNLKKLRIESTELMRRRRR